MTQKEKVSFGLTWKNFALPFVGKVPLTSFTFLTALLHALNSFSKAFPVAPDTILQ